MKRDMDLVRNILMKGEEQEHGFFPNPLRIEGYSDEAVGYHASLMVEAGLVVARAYNYAGGNSPTATLVSLTWEGHEFLEASRNEGRWNKAKQAAGSTGGMVLGVLKTVLIDLATQAAKKAAGLP